MKVDELEKQCKLERIVKVPLNDETIFDFAELAPELFANIRKIHNVTEAMVK
jgi:hypothetical protein